MRTTVHATFALLLVSASFAQNEHVGSIDFFGYEGLDVSVIRAALPLHEGDSITMEPVGAVREAVKRVTGTDPTEVAVVCCDDRDGIMIYVGLHGRSSGAVRYNPVPSGESRLPEEAVEVHNQAMDAWVKSILNGSAAEDDSRGYALSADPAVRARQMALRAYALKNSRAILRVLASSSNAEQRAMAATLLGYSRQNEQQIGALVGASFDANDSVRNNAVRALAVLVSGKPEAGRKIPIDRFIDLLRSGTWTDRNKALWLLAPLTKRRDPRRLSELRSRALPALIEMARWKNPDHAHPARLLLGRIAGLSEDATEAMIQKQQTESIISAATSLR